MPKRISKLKKDRRDVNEVAHNVVAKATAAETPAITRSLRSQIMAEMGRKGGKKGGKRRLETMTPEQRSQIALRAAQTRWAKRKQKAWRLQS